MDQHPTPILNWINHWPEAFAPTMRFLSEATTYGWFKALLCLMVVLMIWRGPRSRTTAIQALLAFPIANGITDLFKKGLPMHRPFQEIPAGEMILRVGWSESMGTASAHSANMAAVAVVFCLGLGRWGVPWAILAFLVGLSRIYNGAHYPYQVALGWTCGIVAGFLVTKTWNAIAARRTKVEPGDNEDHGVPNPA